MAKYLLFFFLLVPCMAKSQNNKAIEYNNKIIDWQNKFGAQLKLLNASFAGSDAKTINKAYSQLLVTANTVVNNITAIGPYKQDTAFWHAAKNLFAFYLTAAKNEYWHLAQYFSHPANQTSQKQSKLQTMMLQLQLNEDKYQRRFITEQKLFALKYDFELKSKEQIKEEQKSAH